MTGPRERVLALLEAAKRVKSGKDPLGREARERLVEVTGLSAMNVFGGLTAHLETRVTEEDLASLLQAAGEAPRVHVILSANVFVGALRALALALAASPHVYVRPSRREGVLARLLTRALDEAGGVTRVTLVDEIAPLPGDEVHVYGRDETIREVRAKLSPDVLVRGHGAGFGLAVIEAGAKLERQAAALAWDVIPFDQRGCLSPRIVLVPEEDAATFAEQLAQALEDRHRLVPRGRVFDEERAAASTWMSTVAMTGGLHRGSWGAVGVDLTARTLLLPPPGRHVHVTAVRDSDHMKALLSPLASFITTIGHATDGPLTLAARSLAPRARLAELGQMQRPPLDGPVDRRDPFQR